ncbi:hypothetical protein PT974_12264 [Cladobotryum mycophilum]|uniref:Uncharacterized protein n=1 Tax=Cladobotryum mycophilum TaxID=491253 RepID=A0ABR0S7I1_9HYPO
MSPLSLRALGAAALMAASASAKILNLNFEDLAISNEQNCGNVTLTNGGDAYHGVWVSSSFFGHVTVFNTTETAACSRKKADAGRLVSPFGYASSAPNVALTYTNEIEFQVAGGGSLINKASFDIAMQFTHQEIAQNNWTVEVNTLQSNFGDVDHREKFTFSLAKDGPGPWHVATKTDAPSYQFLEVSADIVGAVPTRYPSIYVDNVVLENTEK